MFGSEENYRKSSLGGGEGGIENYVLEKFDVSIKKLLKATENRS